MQRGNPGERIEVLRGWTDRVAANTILPEPPEPNVTLDRFRKGESISAEDADSLEALIVPRLRPAVDVHSGLTFAEPWAHLNEAAVQARLVTAIAAVGQLQFTSSELPAYLATAFLVTSDLIMTTRHAAETFATGVGTRDLAFRPGCEPWIDFGSGADAAIQGNLFPVASVVMIHPHLDVALLRLSAPAVAPPLALWSVDPGTLEGHEVAVIGYPQFDIRYSMQVQKQIFGNDPCTKRVMPGRVTPPRLVTSFGRQVFALTHDCITLGGRSGAPVLHISSGRVVGVSFASVYLDANFAVPISELSRDPRFWDLGLTFEDAARPATSPYQDEWDTADPADAMPAAAATVFVSATPAASLRSVVDQLVSDHFSDPHKFREFLAANNHHDVVRAVPSGVDSKELVRALDRRGLIDEEFLYELAHAVPDAPRTSTRGQLSRWLPQSMLSRAMWAAESIDAHAMELYTLGSPWRDYVLGEDGVPEAASATIERLAYDTRPEIQHVLGWLLRRLYESLPAEPERVEALYEALQHIEGGQQHGGPQVAAPVAAPTEPPAMHSIDYLREGLEAPRSVGLIELPATSGAVAAGSSAWLLTPSLVVVPAHVILTKGTSPQARLEADHGAERAKGAKFTLDFDSDRKHANEHAVESVALLDLYLDLAILRLRSPIHDRLPLRVRAEAVTDNLTSLTIVHHPRLGPKQISRDGRILRTGGSDVIYMLDTAPGSAGAPVFDDQWRVIAIHRAFVNYRSAPDAPSVRAKLGTAAASMLSRLHDRENHHALWREVVAAQPALKSVNVNPSTDLADTDKVPIAMQLLDDVRIGDVEGFHLTSQLGDVATGFCSREGLKALVDHPKVLSIELSKPAGSIECAMSVPHVRANIVHNAPLGELGDKALVAIIDSGIDVCHRAFCDDQGRTRIVAFWDQRDARSPAADTTKDAASESPEGAKMVREFELGYGALYLRDDIQKFVDGQRALPATFPSAADTHHGTVVAGIAAGRCTGNGDDYFAGGVAPGAQLAVVRYDLQDASVGYSKGHIDALTFFARLADRLGLPTVVNISNGMNAGGHDGLSPVERQCNTFTDSGQKAGRVIVKSAGNERGEGRHASLTVQQGAVKTLRWRSQNKPAEQSKATEEIEIWFHNLNKYQFRLRPPGGTLSPAIDVTHRELNEYLSNDNSVAALLDPSRVENGGGFLNIKISPGRMPEVQQGEWGLEITGLQVVPNSPPLHAWVELMPYRKVFFQDYADNRLTVTIPGTAEHVISVGAVEVDEMLKQFDGSSWGPTRKGLEKPDLVAPGVGLFGPGASRVDLRSPRSESGTSLAAPHVAGAIALALSACVKSGRPAHNSFRIRQALQETARHGTRVWNEETGYGSLDCEAFFRDLMN